MESRVALGPRPARHRSRAETHRWLVLVALTLMGACAGSERSAKSSAEDQEFLPANLAPRSQELPEGVTAEMIARGDTVFHTTGFCYTCHGTDGSGVPTLGVDLTDREWLHTDGSYQGLLDRIVVGVSAEASSSGVPMPPRGGGRLTDDDVHAVAAYTWMLGRRGR